MQCLEPVLIPVRKNGKIIDYQTVSCMHCEACQEKYKNDWAFRNLLELQSSEKACMVTLTFSDEGLLKHNLEYSEYPADSVCKEETDKFLKRLRKQLDVKVRYFGVSEYGENNTHRPHYHFIFYGIDENHPIFDGKKAVYRKGVIEHYYLFNGIEPWRYGEVEVSAGKITENSIKYMLKYFVKQQGKQTLELLRGRNPLFITFSRKPGIGFFGLQKFYRQLTEQRVGHLGKTVVPLPRYVVEKLSEIGDIDLKEIIALDRREYFLTHKRPKINPKQWLINRRKGKR